MKAATRNVRCKVEFGTSRPKNFGRTKPLRLGVEAVGWIIVGFAGLVVAGERWPAFGCRVFGHDPNRWTWTTKEQDETSCRKCRTTLVRDREPKPETAAAA
jgi:hypothetical protein